MRVKRNAGLTMLEVMITLAIFTVLTLITGYAFLDVSRVVKSETVLTEMNRNAGRALREMSSALRHAVIPVTTGSASGEGFQGILNSPDKGFGIHGGDWLAALREGTDCVPFAVPVDYGGDGDCADDDLILELGIIPPGGAMRCGGVYPASPDDPQRLEGSINRPLAELTTADLDVDVAGDLDPDMARFADVLALPAGVNDAFGLLRFVPFRHPDPVIVSESVLKHDLNGNGNATDRFMLGSLQIVYPDGSANPPVRFLTSPCVLLQLNRSNAPWTPLFKLVRYRRGDKSANQQEFDENAAAGQYAILARLLLYNPLGEKSVVVPGRTPRPLVRKYEGLITLRNMSLDTYDVR